jgi:hypothetical protein
VYYHANLTSVSAPLLTSVGVAFSESLNLYDNPQMSTASFPSLEAIGGSLYIQITALTNLSGFSELTSDLTWFGIISNPVLTDISGLLGLGDADSVDPIITGGLTITYNELLTDELAWAFHDALEAKDTGGAAVSGVVDIRDNGGGGD